MKLKSLQFEKLAIEHNYYTGIKEIDKDIDILSREIKYLLSEKTAILKQLEEQKSMALKKGIPFTFTYHDKK